MEHVLNGNLRRRIRLLVQQYDEAPGEVLRGLRSRTRAGGVVEALDVAANKAVRHPCIVASEDPVARVDGVQLLQQAWQSGSFEDRSCIGSSFRELPVSKLENGRTTWDVMRSLASLAWAFSFLSVSPVIGCLRTLGLVNTGQGWGNKGLQRP